MHAFGDSVIEAMTCLAERLAQVFRLRFSHYACRSSIAYPVPG